MKTFEYPLEIRFGDLDGLGHVNNAVYLTYLETLRLKYSLELFHTKRLEDIPFILGEVTIRYIKPVFYGDEIHGTIWVSRIGTKSFSMHYTIQRGDELVTKGSSEQVWFDYQTQKTLPIPDSFRTQVNAFQGEDWEHK